VRKRSIEVPPASRHVLEREPEVFAVCAEAVEGPGEVGLRGHGERAAGGHDAEQNAGAMCALGAAGEEHVEPELCDVLELALGGRVVDRDRGVVDEAIERVAVTIVVLDGRHQRLGWQERRLDRGAPAVEIVCDRTDVSASVLEQGESAEAASMSLLLLAIDCADEGAALGGEHGLRLLRVAELACALQPASMMSPDA
jgi:hypothetical protein